MHRSWARREIAHHAADSEIRSMGTKGDRLRTRRQLRGRRRTQFYTEVASRKGFEPLTYGLGNRCSILLSYRDTIPHPTRSSVRPCIA